MLLEFSGGLGHSAAFHALPLLGSLNMCISNFAFASSKFPRYLSGTSDMHQPISVMSFAHNNYNSFWPSIFTPSFENKLWSNNAMAFIEITYND